VKAAKEEGGRLGNISQVGTGWASFCWPTPCWLCCIRGSKMFHSRDFHQSALSSQFNAQIGENEAAKASSALDFQLGTNSSHDS